MADKGFNLKVLVPTNDGINISDNGIEARYFLFYNLSNRSYQLAGKVKNTKLDIQSIKKIMNEENIDLILTSKPIDAENKFEIVEQIEINKLLNSYIDKIDKGILV